MPYPNEHAARIRDPGSFDPDSFRSKDIKNGIRIILGKLKGEDSMIVQAYRFSVDQFSPEEVKQWLEDNKVVYLKFEPAKEETISHTGVLGMKWGVRHGPKVPNSSDHNTYSAIRKKKVQDMNDDELKIVTKRTLLVNLYKKSGAITKKKISQMNNNELQSHVDKSSLRKAIVKNPMRRWKIKDFIKTYKLNDAEVKTLLDRVNAENRYYDARDVNVKAAAKYIKTFLDTNP